MTELVATGSTGDGASLVDAQTPVHLALGLGAGLLGINPRVATLLRLGAMLARKTMDSGARAALYGRMPAESLGNEIADVSFEVLGFYLGSYFREREQERVLAEQVQADALEARRALEQINGLGAYYSAPVYVPIR